MNKKIFLPLLLSIISLSSCNKSTCPECDQCEETPEVKTHIVQFNSNGGSYVSCIVVNEGEKANRPTDPSKQNYTFASWTLNNVAFDFNTAITEDITLNAEWNAIPQPNTYLVQFDSNGGTYVPSVLVKEGEKVSKPSDPSKKNYIFNGWFLDSQDYDFNSLITGNLTLKASWIDNLPPEKYSFVFQSDYCSLNNETTYNNGQSVSLTLSLASKFEGCYVLPEDINVLIGDKLGEKGVDYTYDSSTGTLEMQVSANIVISAMCKDSDNFYRVTEEGFDKAVKFENIDYVQREHVYIIYTSGIYLENIVTDYISPTVNHTIAKSMQTAISSPSYSTSETYQAIKGDKAYEYYSGDDFEEREIPKSDFRTSSCLNIEYLLNLASVTYETIEDKFDEKLLSYVFQVTNKDGYKYNVIMSFEGNMLKYLEYEYVDNQYVNEIGYTTYTFLKITPELPTL